MLIPPVVFLLLVSNVAIYYFQPDYPDLLHELVLWPLGGPFLVAVGKETVEVQFQLWQVVTYSFLHGSSLHLFTNMLALFIFGIHLERLWGSGFFTKVYFFSVATAAFTQLVIMSLGAKLGISSLAATLGASGGVFGILLAFGLLFPNQKIYLLIPPMRIKAKIFVVLYGLFSLFAGLTGTFPDIAHFGHLGGMIGGFIMVRHWQSTVGRSRIIP